jgi:hypothetical protein
LGFSAYGGANQTAQVGRERIGRRLSEFFGWRLAGSTLDGETRELFLGKWWHLFKRVACPEECLGQATDQALIVFDRRRWDQVT